MDFAGKIKETVMSVVPMMLIVLALHFTLAPLPAHILAKFVLGGAMLIFGLAVFLLGADIGMIPVGQRVGSAITQKQNAPLMLAIGFLVGFVVTIAEPDVQVLASQVNDVSAAVPRMTLVLMISFGVGFFVLVGLGRILFQVPLRRVLLISYLVLFAVAALTAPEFVGIGFDAGGATTGPMTVPFILALGMGVAAVRKTDASGGVQDDSFGLVGIASVGPIMAVLLMGILAKGGSTSAQSSQEAAALPLSAWAHFAQIAPSVVKEVLAALVPLAAMFAVFQFLLIKMPPLAVRKTVIGMLYTFFGLVIFLTGATGGFIPAGKILGEKIALLGTGKAIIPLGFLFGATVVSAEPAVWVLTKQIEDVSAGHIRRPVLLFSLSAGVAVAVGLAMLRIKLGFSIWIYLIPAYALAILLMFFCPPFFTAIAFDSGGVASGPMSSTFILSFALGASGALGGNMIMDGFGVVAMIAMIPLVALQVLGILYGRAQKKAKKTEAQK